MAFEEDNEIFDALIAPVMRSNVVTPAAPTRPAPAVLDLDEEDVVPERVAKTARFSK